MLYAYPMKDATSSAIPYSGPADITLKEFKGGVKKRDKDLQPSDFTAKTTPLPELWNQFVELYAKGKLPSQAEKDNSRERQASRRESLAALNNIAFDANNGLENWLAHIGLAQTDLNDESKKQLLKSKLTPIIAACDACSELTQNEIRKETGADFKPLNKALTRGLINIFAEIRKKAQDGGQNLVLGGEDNKYLSKEIREKAHAARDTLLNQPKAYVIKEMLWHLNRDAFQGVATNVNKKLDLAGIEDEDAHSLAANIFSRALFSFDPSRGFEFQTYVIEGIKGNLPERMASQQKKERHPGPSIDGRVNADGESFGALHATADTSVAAPDEQIEKGELLSWLNRALNTLPPDKRQMIEMRYGMGSYDGTRTLKEIAAHFRVSLQGVNNSINDSISKLRAGSKGQNNGALPPDTTNTSSSTEPPVTPVFRAAKPTPIEPADLSTPQTPPQDPDPNMNNGAAPYGIAPVVAGPRRQLQDLPNSHPAIIGDPLSAYRRPGPTRPIHKQGNNAALRKKNQSDLSTCLIVDGQAIEQSLPAPVPRDNFGLYTRARSFGGKINRMRKLVGLKEKDFIQKLRESTVDLPQAEMQALQDTATAGTLLVNIESGKQLPSHNLLIVMLEIMQESKKDESLGRRQVSEILTQHETLCRALKVQPAAAR